MPIYSYQIKHGVGEASGTIEAETKEKASSALTKQYQGEDAKNEIISIELQQVMV